MMRYQQSIELPAHCTGPARWPWFEDRNELPSSMPNGRSWPGICVVMPSYNQARYLEAAICSVLFQGYPNLEFIIMDGGSTDGSIEIINKYAPWLSHWQSTTDNGQYLAIQDGFGRSKCELMTWLNSDDLFFPWTLRTVADIFANLPEVQWLGSSMGANTDETNNHIVLWYRRGLNRRWFFEDRPISEKDFINQEGTFWSRKLWEQAGARFDPTLQHAGDFELWARFWQYTDLATVSTPLGIFRRHAGQKTSQMQLYFEEAERTLRRYPSYRPYSRILTKLFIHLVKYLTRNNPEKNWFQLQCSHPIYDFQEKKWRLEKFLEA